MSGGLVLGGVAGQATLTSDCNSNGYNFTANVNFHGVGSTGGFPIGATISNIEFEVPYDDTNPYDLEGQFTYVSFTGAFFFGHSSSLIQLGRAFSASSGFATGFDLSYGDFHGTSSVSSFSSQKCGCENE